MTGFFFFLLSKWKRGITTLLHLANRVFSYLTRHWCVKMNGFIGCTQGQTRATWRLEFYEKLIRVSGLYVTWVLMNLKKYWIFKIPSVNTHACSSQKDFIYLYSNISSKVMKEPCHFATNLSCTVGYVQVENVPNRNELTQVWQQRR